MHRRYGRVYKRQPPSNTTLHLHLRRSCVTSIRQDVNNPLGTVSHCDPTPLQPRCDRTLPTWGRIPNSAPILHLRRPLQDTQPNYLSPDQPSEFTSFCNICIKNYRRHHGSSDSSTSRCCQTTCNNHILQLPASPLVTWQARFTETPRIVPLNP